MKHKKSKLKDSMPAPVVYLCAIFICLFSIMPLLWMVSTSLKAPDEVFTVPPRWIPDHPTFDNFLTVLRNPKMIQYFFNTLIIAGGSTLISMVISILAAYAFARFKFPGSNVVFISYIFSRIIPRVTLIIPFFIILRNIHLYNTHAGLILIYTIIIIPISVWIVKGFFDNVPLEIEEAAIIDGCTPLGRLFRIVLPISAPAIGSITMYAFILAWNEFLLALVLTADKSTQPISVGLAFYETEHGITWGPLMAASVLMALPSLIVILVFQKQLVRGLSEGAVKS